MDSWKTNEIRLESLLPFIQEQLSLGNSVRFSPEGVSMLPMLRPKLDSVVLVSAPERLKKYDIALYRRDNGQFVLHRIVRAGETYAAVGDHYAKLETGLRQDQMIAVVSAFTRNGKTYSVNDFSYRLYAIVWSCSRPLRRAAAYLIEVFRRKK